MLADDTAWLHETPADKLSLDTTHLCHLSTIASDSYKIRCSRRHPKPAVVLVAHTPGPHETQEHPGILSI